MSQAPKNMTVVEHGTENGVPWAVCEAIFGARNGYALLPAGHPWRSLDLQWEDAEQGPDVHWGITYGPTDDGWIGFDYLHSGDWWGDERQFHCDGDQLRTVDEVVAEAKSLARQIAEVSA